MERFLGIDTSCYTTSVAVYDASEGLIGEERVILHVKDGQRGLSQSNMVFQHVRNLPLLFRKLSPMIQNIRGIGVSAFPRRRADSYMPAFLVGKNFGESLAASLDVPIYFFSHQENHAMAAIRGNPELWGNPFYLLHMSGGTQDLLSCTWQKDSLQISLLLRSLDITAGQLIDRVGTALGMHFPCGPELERYARKGQHRYVLPVSHSRGAFSFSGPETKVQRDIKSGVYTAEDIAQGVLIHVSQALGKQIRSCGLAKGQSFVSVGGVMSNQYLREALSAQLVEMGLHPYFADPRYSSDNATGNAFGAFMRYVHENLQRR